MQRLLDKWGLWVAFFVIGGVILWGVVCGPRRPDEVRTGPGSKNAAPTLK